MRSPASPPPGTAGGGPDAPLAARALRSPLWRVHPRTQTVNPRLYMKRLCACVFVGGEGGMVWHAQGRTRSTGLPGECDALSTGHMGLVCHLSFVVKPCGFPLDRILRRIWVRHAPQVVVARRALGDACPLELGSFHLFLQRARKPYVPPSKAPARARAPLPRSPMGGACRPLLVFFFPLLPTKALRLPSL